MIITVDDDPLSSSRWRECCQNGFSLLAEPSCSQTGARLRFSMKFLVFEATFGSANQ